MVFRLLAKEEAAETAEEPVEEAAPEAAEPEVEADGNEEAAADWASRKSSRLFWKNSGSTARWRKSQQMNVRKSW